MKKQTSKPRNLNKTVKAISKIRRSIDCERFSMRDFYAASLISADELKSKNRHTEYIIWRHLGVTWGVLCGSSLDAAASEFSRKHSTAIHSVKVVLNAVEGFGMEEMRRAIERVTRIANESPTIKVPFTEIYSFCQRFYDDENICDRMARRISVIMNERNRTE